MTTRVRLSELRDAFTWVSVDGPFENVAYVSRASGQIWLVTDYDDVGDEAPEDADDESLYLQVPSQKELDLGRSLVLRFAQEHLPERFPLVDEWYNFRNNPRSAVNVLLRLDESSYVPGMGAMGSDHPISWYHEFDGGRAWYTAIGHRSELYVDPLYTQHLLGGLRWAAGVSE